MNDSEKPFACPSPGCNMSFTNEDHLTVHKKKHDMILNFGMNGKGSGFIIDQTPTPTRFIRNCEEVGLFQDLQNVNPFEETFRRAVEGKTGGVSVSEVTTADDTLNTPHIFPQTVDCPATVTVTETANEKCSTETKICSSSREMNRTISQEEEVIKKLKITTTCRNSVQTMERIVVQETDTLIMPKVSTVQTPSSLSINELQLLLKTSDGKLLQLSAVPVPDCQNNVNKIQHRVNLKTDLPLKRTNQGLQKSNESSKLSNAKMKLKQVLTKSLTESVNENSNKETDKGNESLPSKENRRKCIDENRKQDVLERNRASSMRSRAKRKAWIQELENTVKNVNEKNTTLQMEVNTLRSELAKLKTLLLAHKDCAITKAMEKGNSIVVGSRVNIIAASPEIVSPVIDNSVKRTAVQLDAPLASKKILIGKNSTILPKPESPIAKKPNRVRLFKKLPALKIRESSLLSDQEKEQQFLITENSPTKVCESISRGIIQLSPVIHVQNAASKSTGT